MVTATAIQPPKTARSARSAKAAPKTRIPRTPTLDLDHSVVVLVTILANRISNSASITFRKRHGLGATDWKVISTIAIEPNVTGARIAQLIGLDRAAVSRVLKDFAKRGLILVEQSARHSNYQSVALTPAGRALHDEALVTAFEREDILLAPFSKTEHKELVGLLNRLIAQSRLLLADIPPA